MRKTKPYVDPRQEKLWPDIECGRIDTTWRERTISFFGDIDLDFLETISQTETRMSYAPLGNHELRLATGDPFFRYTFEQVIGMPSRRISIQDWELEDAHCPTR